MHRLTDRRLPMDIELGKTTGACAGRHRPLTWRSLMRRAPWPTVSEFTAGRHWFVFGLLATLAAPGCGHQAKIEFANASKPPSVQVIQPQSRKIVREVGQPSFIEAYERTSIFAKPTAFIEKWIVDIGDKVKKDDVLATLFVPELVEDHQTKGETVKLDRERIALAQEVVGVAAGRRHGGRGAAQGGQGYPG